MVNREQYRLTSDCIFANVTRIFKKEMIGDEEIEKQHGILAEAKLTTLLQKGLNTEKHDRHLINQS